MCKARRDAVCKVAYKPVREAEGNAKRKAGHKALREAERRALARLNVRLCTVLIFVVVPFVFICVVLVFM